MSFFTGEAQSFESFSFVSPFPKARHVAGRSTSSMAKVCVKRPLFCISGVSEQLHGTGVDGEKLTYNTFFHMGEGATGGRYPPESDKVSEIFTGLMVFSYLHTGLLLHQGYG